MTKMTIHEWIEFLRQYGEECQCPVWGPEEHSSVPRYHPIEHRGEPRSLSKFVYSPHAGGVFDWNDHRLSNASPKTKEKFSRWVYDQNRQGEVPTIQHDDIAKFETLPRLGINQRIDRLLRFFADRSDGSHSLYIERDTAAGRYETTELLMAATESSSNPETIFWLLSQVKDMGLLLNEQATSRYALTVKALERLESQDVGGSRKAFVAMWFDNSTLAAYDQGVEPAVRDAGYEPVRIDRQEHSNKIDDEIISEIRRSRFVIADFTCGTVLSEGKEVAIPRGGVYYETGFAQGLGLPVIWTCRQDQIDQVHFDTRQFNHILWTDPHDLHEKLRNRISAVIGDGPLRRS